MLLDSDTIYEITKITSFNNYLYIFEAFNI